MAYTDKSGPEQEQLRNFVSEALQRYSSFRDNKEAMAYAGLALYTGAAATALASKDWPPGFAANRRWLILSAFTILWGFVIIYLRYQLRRRRWAALRVAGCEWLLAEWLPGSPRAMSKEGDPPKREGKPSRSLRFIDYLWPMAHSVPAIKSEYSVYPDEIEEAFLRSERRGTEALIHERLIHVAGWIAYLAVILRTYFG